MKTKSEVRKEIWKKMEEKDVARFPTPIEGRIPNFVGAERAAEKLNEVPAFRSAERIKVNPDSPQNAVRAEVIKKGKTLFMPTPRLRDGFLKIEPKDVPDGKEKKATTIKHSNVYGDHVDPKHMEDIDLVVAGSVAVSEDGRRVGKGEGYSDLEYAILR
ncbi:MAG: 5-formyltetrahydrofolate cyclo-ligase, partial [Candidatus Natronoplasma sp.]